MKTIIFNALFLFITMGIHAQQTQALEIKIQNGTLKGELTSSKEDQILVLMIAGSGPTDRDGNNPAMKNNSLKMLSDSLLSQGISTFRFDKRGVAQSQVKDLNEEDMNIDTMVEDVKKWINLLSFNSTRKIVILGHSEGSLIGMLASKNNEKVKGFISLAGPGSSADSIIIQQIGSRMPALLPKTTSYLSILKTGKRIDSVDKMMYMLFRPSVQPYMISWINKNPCTEITKLSMPILILQGDQDLQVNVSDAEKLAQCAPNSKKVILKDMNHVMKEVHSFMENQTSYADPNKPLHSQLTKEIRLFLNAF
jgi:pimeloyl-ACP methyl ester carboxylesterase